MINIDALPAAGDNAWGLALLALALLLPRAAVRFLQPIALERLGRRRRWCGYLAALAAAEVTLLAAQGMGLRPWVEALPVNGLQMASRASAGVTCLGGGLAALAAAVWFAAPIAAWLNAHGRANGVLIILLSLPLAVALGAASAFAWQEPWAMVPFSVASAVAFLVPVSAGFSAGAGFPLRIRFGATVGN